VAVTIHPPSGKPTMTLTAVAKPLDPTTPRGAWKPIQQALVKGSSLPPITVSDPLQAGAIASGLRTASARSPWLLSLTAADPHRVLRAAGIELQGSAREAFGRQQWLEGWGGRTAEFEKAAQAPPRLSTPKLLGS